MQAFFSFILSTLDFDTNVFLGWFDMPSNSGIRNNDRDRWKRKKKLTKKVRLCHHAFQETHLFLDFLYTNMTCSVYNLVSLHRGRKTILSPFIFLRYEHHLLKSCSSLQCSTLTMLTSDMSFIKIILNDNAPKPTNLLV